MISTIATPRPTTWPSSAVAIALIAADGAEESAGETEPPPDAMGPSVEAEPPPAALPPPPGTTSTYWLTAEFDAGTVVVAAARDAIGAASAQHVASTIAARSFAGIRCVMAPTGGAVP